MQKKYLVILELTDDCTLDDIKKSYRNLSKKYHPDINPNGADKFILLTDAYDYLMKNFVARTQKPKTTFGTKFFRTIGGKMKSFMITLPMEVLDEDVIVYCMFDTGELKLSIAKGTKLPIQLKIVEGVYANVRYEDEFNFRRW